MVDDFSYSLGNRILGSSGTQKRAELLRFSPAPGGVRIPEYSPGGLPLLGNSTDLLHHVEGVIVDPLFLDFSAGDAVEEVAGKGYLIAGRSAAHKLTLVGTPDRPARNHAVTFGYHLIDSNLKIREAGMVGAHKVLKTLRTTHLSLSTGGTVADEVGSEQLID